MSASAVPVSSRFGGRARHAYSGASLGDGNLALWRPTLASADAELFRDGPTLRARARDLERNHPFARQAVRTSRLGVIGKHLRYSCRPDWRFLGIDEDDAIRWAQEWERIWEGYAHSYRLGIDAGRRMTFTGLMSLAHDADFVDGEFLMTAEWDPRRRWNTCWQMVDVDRLSTPVGRNDSRFLKAGVELDLYGAPIAYHIRDAHPAEAPLIDVSGDQMRWSRVARETGWGRPVAIHGYDVHRAGQTRGRSEFSSVLSAMKMGAEYVETALQTAILQASYAAVLESKNNYKEAMEAIGMGPDASKMGAGTLAELAAENLEAVLAYHDEINLRFAGSKIPKLYPGETLHMVSPGSNAASLGEFQQHSTRSYAAGMGVDPIGVSQDYSNVNYSSAKMSQATTFRYYETKRDRFAYTTALPMVGALLEEAVHSGAIDLPKGLSPADFYQAQDALVRGVFLAQGAPNLDPVKEAAALEKRMQLGLDTLQDAAAAEGRDYRDVAAQRRREIKEFGPVAVPASAPPSAAASEKDAGDGE